MKAPGSVRWIALLLLGAAGLGLAPPPTLAQDAVVRAPSPGAREINVALPLRSGQRILGELGVRIEPDGRILLPRDDLLRRLTPFLNAEGVNRLGTVPAEGGFLPLERIRDAGLDIAYDPLRLEIAFTPSPDLAASEELSFRRQALGPLDITPSEGVSAFVNLFASYELDWEDDVNPFGRGRFRVLSDGALHFGGLTLEGEGSFDDQQGFRRFGSRLVYDDPARLFRVEAGDVIARTVGFQGSDDVLGLTIFRSFGELGAGLAARSTGSQSFRLDRPARVDILVNGGLLRTLDLQPGTFDLRDLGLGAGGNDIQLIVTDDTGRREVLDFTLFFDSALLAPGETEFSITGGVRSDLDSDQRSYDTDDPVFSGFARHGVTDALTAGLNAQADEKVGVLGTELLFATPLGVFDVDAAYSQVWDGETGYAFDIDYDLAGFRLFADDDAARRLSLSWEHRSDDFEALGGTGADGFSHRFAGAYSQRLFGNFRFGLSGSHERGGAGVDRTDINLTLSGPFLVRRSRFAATLGYAEGDTDFEGAYGLLSLSFSLGEDRSANAFFDSRDNRVQLGYLTFGPDEIGAVDYALTAGSDDDQSDLFGTLSYRGNRFDLALDHDLVTNGAFGRIDTNRTTLRASSALVLAGSHVALSRPVDEAFVIVAPHRTLERRPVTVDPASARRRYESDLLGPAVINDLSANASRRIAVDVEDLPLGYDLGAGADDVRPGYKAGYVYEVGSDYSVTLVAIARDREGAPVGLVSGSALEVDSTERVPVQVFTNREGRLVAQGLRPGKWSIELATDPMLRYLVTIPEDAVGLVRLGDLTPDGS